MDSYYEKSSLSIIMYKENQNKDVLQFVKMLGKKEQEEEGRPGPTYSGRYYDEDPILSIYITFKK